MSKRIIEIGSPRCYLKYRYAQLVIEREGEELPPVPIEDLAAVVIDHPQATITQVCLSALLQANVMVVSSDKRHQPVGMFLPLDSHTLQTERFAAQIKTNLPVKKLLWKQLVQAKVRFQAKVLKDITGNDAGLAVLAKKVRSGDPDNIEGQAARRYWSRLFPEGKFKRERDALDQNRFLNYSYAILRALVSRSLCATGLHPSLGIHHHNRYNAYCLADDLMEPYRPFVDLNVWRIVDEHGGDTEMDKTIRGKMLTLVTQPVPVQGEQLTMQGAVQRSAQSLWQVIVGERKELVLPEV